MLSLFRMYFASILGLSWVLGNAEELPFDDDKFDVYTIAFGIRNVTRIDLVSCYGIYWQKVLSVHLMLFWF